MKHWIWAFILFAAASCTQYHPSSYFSAADEQLEEDGDRALASEGLYGPKDDEFIPLNDSELQMQFSDLAFAQPQEIPGEPGSGLPTLNKFREAAADLARVFQNVFFNTDDHTLRKADYFKVIDGIAAYLKSHPKVYMSVEGHCDERASEAYNLALGTRRANYIRSLMVQKGVDANRIHTISFGKEKPADEGHTQTAWAKNRRVEFKIYEKN